MWWAYHISESVWELWVEPQTWVCNERTSCCGPYSPVGINGIHGCDRWANLAWQCRAVRFWKKHFLCIRHKDCNLQMVGFTYYIYICSILCFITSYCMILYYIAIPCDIQRRKKIDDCTSQHLPTPWIHSQGPKSIAFCTSRACFSRSQCWFPRVTRFQTLRDSSGAPVSDVCCCLGCMFGSDIPPFGFSLMVRWVWSPDFGWLNPLYAVCPAPQYNFMVSWAHFVIYVFCLVQPPLLEKMTLVLPDSRSLHPWESHFF